jgi:hypothetical protein
MENSEINNFNQSLEKFIYKSTLYVDSYLQSTTFLPKNIIYNLHVLTLFDLQSTMKIVAKSTIYNLTSPPPPLTHDPYSWLLDQEMFRQLWKKFVTICIYIQIWRV